MSTTANYGAVRSVAQLEQFFDRMISSGKPFGFDIESGYSGPDKEKAALLPFYPHWFLVGFSFTNSPTDWARYVPVSHDSGDNIDDEVAAARLLWKLLQTGLGVAHNATFELKGLSRWFRDKLSDDPEVGAAVRASQGLFPVRSDTMIEAFMLAKYAPKPQGPGLGLKELTKHVFGHQMTEFLSLFGELARGKGRYVRFNSLELTPEVIEYACEDALWCLALHLENYEECMSDARQLMFRTEILLMPVLVEMEIEALLLDWGKIASKTKEVVSFRDKMNEEILSVLSERLGEVVNINLASVPQLSEILFNRLNLPVKERSEKTDKPSTSESALRSIAKEDPIIKRILEYREVVKLNGSYLNKYNTELNYAGNDRAYPNHNQTGALTGRFSVDGVSYQQWPKPYHYELRDGTTFDMSFKDLLIAPKGFRIMGYDFSQVELRVLAGQAEETTLLRAFAEGIDIHKQTAATMFGIELAAVTKGIRANGKTLNFAVVYGSGAGNIAEMLTKPESPVTKEDAQELLDKYFAGFPKLKAWMDARVVEGREQGYVETMFGRKFTVWEYKDYRNFIKAKGDRMCVNAPIQGGAADYMKLGMVRVSRAIKAAEAEGRIPKGGIRLIMTIHDALEFYVADEVDSQTVIDIVQPQISFPVKGLPEIRADWHEGYRWGSVIEIKQDAQKKISSYAIEDVDQEFSEISEAYIYLSEKFKKPLNEVWPTAPEDILMADDETPGTEPVIYAEGSDQHLDHLLASREEPRSEEIVVQVSSNRNGEKIVEEEPEWLHGAEWRAEHDAPEAVLSLTEMPTPESWDAFLEFLKSHAGKTKLVIETPEGDIALDYGVALSREDQPTLSLMMGGAALRFITEDTDKDELLSGVEL